MASQGCPRNVRAVTASLGFSLTSLLVKHDAASTSSRRSRLLTCQRKQHLSGFESAQGLSRVLYPNQSSCQPERPRCGDGDSSEEPSQRMDQLVTQVIRGRRATCSWNSTARQAPLSKVQTLAKKGLLEPEITVLPVTPRLQRPQGQYVGTPWTGESDRPPDRWTLS